MRGAGEVDLNGFNESVGPLELLGGLVNSSGGLLTLLADVVVSGPAGTNEFSFLDGNVSLGNLSRTFTVTTNGGLFASASLSGNPNVGFTKAGAGSMSVWGHSIYSGTTYVNEGSLSAGHGFVANETPLGSTTGGTVVKPGCRLELNSVVIDGEALVTTLTFTDPGADTWTATVNYGDGTATQPLVVGANKSLPLNHTFPTNGLYTVTANDDDTGSASTTLEVYVGLELTLTQRNHTHSFVRWPGAFTGFTLQSTPSLPGGTNWTAVAEAPALVSGQWQALVPHTNSHAFFRLFKP